MVSIERKSHSPLRNNTRRSRDPADTEVLGDVPGAHLLVLNCSRLIEHFHSGEKATLSGESWLGSLHEGYIHLS